MRSYIEDFKKVLDSLDLEQLDIVRQKIQGCRGTIYLMGNGGSAAIAEHLACDLTNKGYNAKALTANSAVLTALANDKGYERVFIDQLTKFDFEKDLIVLFSVSGTSPNIVKVLDLYGPAVCCFFGFGRRAREGVTASIDCTNYGMVEDAFSVCCHILSVILPPRLLSD